MTSFKSQIPPSDPPLSPPLPTMYDLPSEDPEEPGLPDIFHSLQPSLLSDTFRPPNYPEEQMLVASDLNLYYDLRHTDWYKRPDWYAVVGVPRLYEGYDLRSSYVIWQEEVSPIVIVELLSPNTENEDLGRTVRRRGSPPTKWQVYERILRVPYYVVFSRYTDEVQIFRLVDNRYERASITEGRLLIPELGLSLGLWQGKYKGLNRLWLRWFTLEGESIPIPSEEAAEAKQQAMQAKQEATEAKQQVIQAKQEATEAKQQAMEAEQKAAEAIAKAERLAAKMRELNIDPNQF